MLSIHSRRVLTAVLLGFTPIIASCGSSPPSTQAAPESSATAGAVPDTTANAADAIFVATSGPPTAASDAAVETTPPTAAAPTTADMTPAPALDTASAPVTVPAGQAVDPNAVEVVDPGDIPDDQAFVPYIGSNYEIRVPEGWPRSDAGATVSFTDKYNSIKVREQSATAAPTVDSVQATGLSDVSADPTYRAGTTTSARRTGGTAIRATYEIASEPNAVTGKRAVLAVERYVYFAHGHEVVVTLSGAKGADNVDPWKIVTDSVRVR